MATIGAEHSSHQITSRNKNGSRPPPAPAAASSVIAGLLATAGRVLSRSGGRWLRKDGQRPSDGVDNRLPQSVHGFEAVLRGGSFRQRKAIQRRRDHTAGPAYAGGVQR